MIKRILHIKCTNKIILFNPYKHYLTYKIHNYLILNVNNLSILSDKGKQNINLKIPYFQITIEIKKILLSLEKDAKKRFSKKKIVQSSRNFYTKQFLLYV